MQLLEKFESAKGPSAIGPYSPAVRLGDFVFISGQLGMDVNGVLAGDDVESQTHMALKNIGYLLAEIGLNYEHVVKTTVFVTDLNDFGKVNEIYGEYFHDVYPARSCVEVSKLPKNAKVEIECIVFDTLLYEQQIEQQAANSCDCGDPNCGGDCGCGCC